MHKILKKFMKEIQLFSFKFRQNRNIDYKEMHKILINFLIILMNLNKILKISFLVQFRINSILIFITYQDERLCQALKINYQSRVKHQTQTDYIDLCSTILEQKIKKKMNKILQLFSCQIFGHDDEKIIGICENLNCAQPYRRVCFQCLKSHQELDPQFEMKKIMSEKRLQTIINEFKSIQENVINKLLQSCRIQQLILIIEMVEFLKVWKLKLSYQKDLSLKLSVFYQQEFKKISVEDYLLGDSNNQGIFRYLKKIEDKIAELDNYHKNYLINLLNIKQPEEQKNGSINNEMSTSEQQLQDILINLSQNKEKLFKSIDRNLWKKQPQQIDNPQVEFWELVLKQGKQQNNERFRLKNAESTQIISQTKAFRLIRKVLRFIFASLFIVLFLKIEQFIIGLIEPSERIYQNQQFVFQISFAQKTY
ncbi:hypothetical protein pb186bvf_013090 [Paramecium bursaria]